MIELVNHIPRYRRITTTKYSSSVHSGTPYLSLAKLQRYALDTFRLLGFCSSSISRDILPMLRHALVKRIVHFRDLISRSFHLHKSILHSVHRVAKTLFVISTRVTRVSQNRVIRMCYKINKPFKNTYKIKHGFIKIPLCTFVVICATFFWNK